MTLNFFFFSFISFPHLQECCLSVMLKLIFKIPVSIVLQHLLYCIVLVLHRVYYIRVIHIRFIFCLERDIFSVHVCVWNTRKKKYTIYQFFLSFSFSLLRHPKSNIVLPHQISFSIFMIVSFNVRLIKIEKSSTITTCMHIAYNI